MHLDMLTAEFGPAGRWIGAIHQQIGMTPPETSRSSASAARSPTSPQPQEGPIRPAVLSLRSVIGRPAVDRGVEDLRTCQWSGPYWTDSAREAPFEYERLGHIPNLGRAVGSWRCAPRAST